MISPMRKGCSVQPQVEKSKAQLGPKIRFRFGETSIPNVNVNNILGSHILSNETDPCLTGQ